MNKLFLTLSIVLTSALATIPVYQAHADDDHIEARQLQALGKILPLESILQKVRSTHPGKILEVELEKENGKIVYEVEILSDDGIVTEVYVDAKTGQLLSSEKDD